MDTFEAIIVNNTTIKVDNRTDYYIEQWLCSDYGFRLFYVPAKGIAEVYWKELLIDHRFNYDDMTKNRKFNELETRKRSIDFHKFMSRRFALEFISNDRPYGLYYDWPAKILIMSNTDSFWDIL